jgi:hypothetical protein
VSDARRATGRHLADNARPRPAGGEANQKAPRDARRATGRHLADNARPRPAGGEANGEDL